MDDLIAFLNARLDDDERLASAASPGPWSENAESDEVMAVDGITVCDGFALSGNQLRATVAHIARHDPARVLAEVEAKRRILDEHRPIVDGDRDPAWPPPGHCAECWSPKHEDYHPWPCRIVRLLALSYADHEDYREVWKL